MSPAVSGGGYHHAQRGGKLAASKGEGFDAHGAVFTGKQKSDGEGKKENVRGNNYQEDKSARSTGGEGVFFKSASSTNDTFRERTQPAPHAGANAASARSDHPHPPLPLRSPASFDTHRRPIHSCVHA